MSENFFRVGFVVLGVYCFSLLYDLFKDHSAVDLVGVGYYWLLYLIAIMHLHELDERGCLCSIRQLCSHDIGTWGHESGWAFWPHAVHVCVELGVVFGVSEKNKVTKQDRRKQRNTKQDNIKRRRTHIYDRLVHFTDFFSLIQPLSKWIILVKVLVCQLEIASQFLVSHKCHKQFVLFFHQISFALLQLNLLKLVRFVLRRLNYVKRHSE